MRLLIADDHALFRGGLRVQLRELDAQAEVFEAADFLEMLDIVEREPPLDLILADLGMPGMAWREALATLRQQGKGARIVTISGSDSPSNVREALGLGAAGFISKADSPAVMIAALKLVMSGGVYIPAAILAQRGPESPPDHGGTVTHRQREVLSLLAEGHSNKEIAYRLSLTEGTVKLHVAAILKTLGATNRTQAVAAARSAGMLEQV